MDKIVRQDFFKLKARTGKDSSFMRKKIFSAAFKYNLHPHYQDLKENGLAYCSKSSDPKLHKSAVR